MDENHFQPRLYVRPRGICAAAIFSAAAVVAMLAASCTASEKSPFVIANDVGDGGASGFTNTLEEPDAAGDSESNLTSYCPSSKCPAGYRNCPNSRFPCDVNLRTDRQNCGACGVVCQGYNGREQYECVDGQCVLQCMSFYLDCDGFTDNGCEAVPSSNDSCGFCGNPCSEPDKPCTLRGLSGKYGCGCPVDQLLCSGACIDPRSNDMHCGGCGNACDPTGGGKPEFPNGYYGCHDGRCDNLKCDTYYGNCDGKMGNGCEVSLLEKQNCGACGNACASGQECRLDPANGEPQCMCPGGKTLCSMLPGCIVNPFLGLELCYGGCFDTTSDKGNCGVCGAACESETDTAIATCLNGTCKLECVAGRADCNGNASDGCEVNADSDPRNCGGCGLVCDAVAGQACVGGRCVVEPCSDVEADAGGPK